MYCDCISTYAYMHTYMKQKLTELKGEIDSSTTIVGDLTYFTFNNEQGDQTEMNKQTEHHHKPTRVNNHP